MFPSCYFFKNFLITFLLYNWKGDTDLIYTNKCNSVLVRHEALPVKYNTHTLLILLTLPLIYFPLQTSLKQNMPVWMMSCQVYPQRAF